MHVLQTIIHSKVLDFLFKKPKFRLFGSSLYTL